MTDIKNPFSIVAPLSITGDIPALEGVMTYATSESVPPEQEPDIRTPIERMIQKELKSDKFLLAYYDENGDVGFYTGEGMDPEGISFITDVMKARVMMQLLLD